MSLNQESPIISPEELASLYSTVGPNAANAGPGQPVVAGPSVPEEIVVPPPPTEEEMSSLPILDMEEFTKTLEDAAKAGAIKPAPSLNADQK